MFITTDDFPTVINQLLERSTEEADCVSQDEIENAEQKRKINLQH